MPGWFIAAIIFAVMAVIATVVMMVLRNSADKSIARLAAFVLIGLVVVATLISSATVVSTKNVGIVTVFGRPSGSLSNGLHFVAPWAKVTELDAAIQTDSRTRANTDPDDCVTVRIARQAQACVDTSIRWRIKPEASDELFRDYREFSNIRDSLVTRELIATLNLVFETYDPLGIDENGDSTVPDVNTLSQEATSKMQEKVGGQIEVLNVIIGVVYLDGETQKRVDALQAQVAQTRINEQAIMSADKQAEANRKLAESVDDPNVLVSKCYDLVGEMLNKNITPPVAFNCWPGGGSPVVLPAVGPDK
jgi:regulator of protease activity HflC (stomatin/prohibitin superfamily)